MNPLRMAAALLAGLFAMPGALAFTIPFHIPIVEYFHPESGHYQLVRSAGTMPAGTWIPTGYSFNSATVPIEEFCTPSSGNCPVTVRSYRAVGSGSVLFTANPVEIATLGGAGSGWLSNNDGFRIPVPRADGSCASPLKAVHRLYNGRAAFNDSNHRYVFNDELRGRLVARGWIEEGPVFCAYSLGHAAIVSRLAGSPIPHRSGECGLSPCVAAVNLPVPGSISGNPNGPYQAAFFDRTGLRSSFAYAQHGGAPTDAAHRSFTQVWLSGSGAATLGIFLQGSDREGPGVASLSPSVSFREDRSVTLQHFIPFWRNHEDVEMRIAFTASVKQVTAGTPGSHAYALPVVELLDVATGGRIQVSIQAFGTVPPGDVVTRDGSGKVIVSTSFGPSPAFGRSVGLPFLLTPGPRFVATNSWGLGGAFDFRISREEFARMLEIARSVDPGLSASPDHYLVSSFQLRVEATGDASIGLNVTDLRIEMRSQ